MNSFEKIYEQVKKIPKGKVATYSQIALLAGNPLISEGVTFIDNLRVDMKKCQWQNN